ncbi:MAG: hypothetical protein C0425_11755 [Chlorobiaceae bacterium]|nr:hypothetical protein [Chlorobiaceae bacterium]MBA4310989.1 hypothetical protein [Chlorobiaceae bacterium]
MIELTPKQIAEHLTHDIEAYSNNKLESRANLQKILEIFFNKAEEGLLDEMTFTAKHIRGLVKVLGEASTKSEIQNIEQIKSDLSANIEKFREQIKNLISNESEEEKKFYEKNFLSFDEESFKNMQNLWSDLTWTKLFLNELRRKSEKE